ncbi:MAG: SDR family NAD(P)-dependent oxidoreductase [Flavobacteriales bacterium]
MTDYALVTGAAAGLGRAFLEALAKRGYNIIGVSRPGDDVNRVVSAIATKHGVQGLGCDLDLSVPGCALELKQWTEQNDAEVVFLINNVGTGGVSEFETSTHAANRLMMELNMRTMVEMCREFLPDMIARGEGQILNVSSMAANFPMPFKSIYSASKSFVRSFSIGLRGEMKRHGVNVSVTQPGAMLTNQVVIDQLKHGSALSRVSAMKPGDVAEFSVRRTLEGRSVITPGIKNWLTLGMLRVFPRPLKTAMAVFNYIRTKKKSNPELHD